MIDLAKRIKKLEESSKTHDQEKIIMDYLNAVSLYVTNQDFEKEMDNLDLDNFNFNVFQNSFASLYKILKTEEVRECSRC